MQKKVYLFNCKNVYNVIYFNEKPIMEQVGPFVFNEETTYENQTEEDSDDND